MTETYFQIVTDYTNKKYLEKMYFIVALVGYISTYHGNSEVRVNRIHYRSQSPSSSVTGHLEYGETHVAANAERDAETNAAEQSQLEASGAS